MYAILKAQLQQLRRNPMPMLMMIGLSIVFTVMMGVNVGGKITVYTFYDNELKQEEAQRWLELLNRSETFAFEMTDEDKSREKVIDGHAEFALQLLPDDYRIIAAVDSLNLPTLDLYIRNVYEDELSIRAAESGTDAIDIRSELERRSASPVLSVTSTVVESETTFEYDSRVQSLFGFALFFSIYTVAYGVNAMLHEKKNGIWDRVILSPVSKTSMYVGHLVNSYIAGFVQIAIVFTLFRYVFRFPLGDSFITILVIAAVFTFSIVALSMLLAGLVRTPQQMSVLIPIVGVSSAMIGGAYWPIEIVTNPILLALSKVIPITYGMDALKGVAYYGYTWSDLIQPVSYMFLFGVICMGIGVNLVEKRSR